MYIYICIYIYVYIYTYICVYIHTYMYTMASLRHNMSVVVATLGEKFRNSQNLCACVCKTLLYIHTYTHTCIFLYTHM